MSDSGKALIVRETQDGFIQSMENINPSDLKQNDVLIKVEYAALNYKDALSTFGHKGITRAYPHVPGVDAAGIVIEDKSGKYSSGQNVICTSFDLGMNTWGGFGRYISVPSEWLIPLPENLTLKDSMILGTAAYTAGLALHKMEQMGQNPEMGPIVVTGATGGVGSMSVGILSKAGYKVVASTGKKDKLEFLMGLGATVVEDRSFTNDDSGKPLIASKWAGAIDNVGGNTLATLLKACGRNGNVASIGLVGSPELHTTVYPFILNGVNLLGIDSAETPIELRKRIWQKISSDWKPEHLDKICTEIGYDELLPSLEKLKKGRTTGRYVLRHE